MYPVGLLFGLGFDTATEIALLATAGAAAAGGLPIYAILCLPILFAAGMSLLDTIDGAFMNFAYGWAFAKPVRKIFYNITITSLSVFVALVIGTIELMSVLTEKLSLTRPAVGLRLRPRPELRGLRDRRRVRPDLGRRAARLAPRRHRGEVVRRRWRARARPRAARRPDGSGAARAGRVSRHDERLLKWPIAPVDNGSMPSVLDARQDRRMPRGARRRRGSRRRLGARP